MSDKVHFLTERLQSEGDRTLAFFQALMKEQWQRTIYTEGGNWSIHQLLAHFVSTEAAFYRLIRNILEGGEGAPVDFDIDKFNQGEVKKRRNFQVEVLMRQFEEYRQDNIKLVSGMREEDLTKKGRHPFLGFTPIEDIVKLLYRHNQIHLRDIRRVLNS